MIFEQHREVYFDVVDILPESNRGISGLGYKDTTVKKQSPPDPRKAPIKTSVNIVERWKEAGDDIPIPQKYEAVAREREKLIP